MPYLALKAFAQSVAEGSAPSVQAQTIWKEGVKGFRQAPILDKLGAAIGVVAAWLPEADERRIAIPRGGGAKEINVHVLLLLHAVGKDAEGVVGDNWDIACGLLAIAYRTAAMPTTITNPLTGLQYHLREIGEEIRLHQTEPGKYGSAGLAHYYAEMLVSAVIDLPNS